MARDSKSIKIYLGITFDSKLTFQKHFEEILGRCNTRYHRVRLIVNKKWGPSPSTILQIYKQCVPQIFENGSLSTITTSDTIISKIQRLQSKFIRLALRLPKYISAKLLHDSSGLPYVKDRLLSCAARTLKRISKNPLVEESITFNRVNPAWDRSPTPLSVIPPVSLWTNMTYGGNFSKHLIAPETGSPAYTRTRLAQSSDLKKKERKKPTQATLLVFLSWDALCVPQVVGSMRGHRQYLIHLVKFTYIQSRNNTIKKKIIIKRKKHKKKHKKKEKPKIYLYWHE